jgi:hypothetical protein
MLITESMGLMVVIEQPVSIMNVIGLRMLNCGMKILTAVK